MNALTVHFNRITYYYPIENNKTKAKVEAFANRIFESLDEEKVSFPKVDFINWISHRIYKLENFKYEKGKHAHHFTHKNGSSHYAFESDEEFLMF